MTTESCFKNTNWRNGNKFCPNLLFHSLAYFFKKIIYTRAPVDLSYRMLSINSISGPAYESWVLMVSIETGRISNRLRKLPLNRIFHVKALITFLDLSFFWRVCYQLNYVLLRGHVEVLISGISVHKTLFGNRVFADTEVIKLRWGFTGWGWAEFQ